VPSRVVHPGRTGKDGVVGVLLEHGFRVFGEFVSWAEFFGQIGALAVVFLAQRRTLWAWPVQLAATVLLFAVYTSAHLGGLASRQVVIFAISLYGWWAWLRHRDSAGSVRVRVASWRERIGLLVVLGLGTVGMALLLIDLNASWAPWPDAWIFVGTVVAFAGQGLGLVEFWVVWLLVDAVGVPLQIGSHLYFSALVYTVFAVLVVRGFLDWRRTARAGELALVDGGVAPVQDGLDGDGGGGGQGERGGRAERDEGQREAAVEADAADQPGGGGAEEPDGGRRTGAAVGEDR
jgi:nicotinamide mononucleotide transporter